jgi:ribosomal protein L34E
VEVKPEGVEDDADVSVPAAEGRSGDVVVQRSRSVATRGRRTMGGSEVRSAWDRQGVGPALARLAPLEGVTIAPVARARQVPLRAERVADSGAPGSQLRTDRVRRMARVPVAAVCGESLRDEQAAGSVPLE